MKKIFAVVAVVVLATLAGCAGEEPEVESTTVVESTTADALTPEPVATETEGNTPAAIEPATENDATTDGEAVAEDDGMALPKNHTVDKEGVMHAPGAENASKRCVACHGKDLDGGKSGVSCLDCHEQSWS